MDELTVKTIEAIITFFDANQKGHIGNSGYRKTSSLSVLFRAVKKLMAQNIIQYKKTVFLDLGCGDGRVCMLMSYICKQSIGIELEDFIYDEYREVRNQVENILKLNRLLPFPDNMLVINGDSLSAETHKFIKQKVDIELKDVDIFYTYITLHDAFASMLKEKARKGSYYMVYGFSGVLPRYDSFELVDPDVANEKLIALYRKR